MIFEIALDSPLTATSDCLVIGVEAQGRLTPTAALIDNACKGLLTQLIQRGDIQGKTGEYTLLFDPEGITALRLLIVGLGEAQDRKDRHFRKLVKGINQHLSKLNISSANLALDGLACEHEDLYRQTRLWAEWTSQDFYRYDATKSKKAEPASLSHCRFHTQPDDAEFVESALMDAQAIAAGVGLACHLGNLPGNICTPSFLAEEAQKMAKEHKKVKVKILDEAQMEELGMHSLLSVGRGSRQPSCLIVIEYQGNKKTLAPHVLVGKGITFDTGGISLKPAAAMDEMKFDMCGAASVLGATKTALSLQLPINLVTIVAAAENMPDGQATKPGDVVTTLSGQTVEILNTDAEGRLVLCDALTYAERFKPASVIDVATLTGACVIALGAHASGLFANNEDLADQIINAGDFAADRTWPLPIWEEYQDSLESNFADMANVGGKAAGSITAACFLSRFTKKYPWAHLDIAGVAWHGQGKDKGASGRCVPLLSQFLIDQAELAEEHA